MAKGQIFSELPPMARGIIAVALIGGAGFLVYRIYKEIQKNQSLAGAKKEGDAVKSELNTLNSNPSTKATLNQAQLAGLANKIHAAMDGYGTDNKAILAAMAQLKNDADVLGLISAYGVRKISSGSLNPAPNFEGTLTAALTEEVPQTGYGVLNYALLAVNPIAGVAAINNGDIGVNSINKLLEQKKIKYRF